MLAPIGDPTVVPGAVGPGGFGGMNQVVDPLTGAVLQPPSTQTMVRSHSH